MKSIRKSVLVLSALLAVGAANACSVTFDALDQKVSSSLRAAGGFNFKNYDQVCEKLEKANASIFITSMNGVVNERAFAVAYVMVKDKKTSVVAITQAGRSAQLSASANSAEADALLPIVINNAINNLNVDVALADLAVQRKQAK